jgi:hypothetical protein
MQTAVGMNLIVLIILQLLTGQAIKFLWPLYNIVQLFICLYDMQVPLPVNVRAVIGNVKDALALNAIPKEDIKEHILTTPWIKSIFESGGMIVTFGLPLLLITIFAIFLISRCSRKSKKCQDFITKIKNKIFWNTIIRSILISFLPLAISSNIGRQLNLNGDSPSANYAIIILQLGQVVLSLQMALFTDPIELSNPVNIAKFGSFYDTVRFHRTLSMIFNSLFMIRRLLFVVFMHMSIFSVRIGLLATLQSAWIAYLVLERPLEDPVMMNLEILNEAIFYVCIFVLPLFTELVLTAEDRYNMGYIMLGLLGLLVFCNLFAAIYKVVTKIRENRKKKQEEAEKEKYLLGLENAPKSRVWCYFCKALGLHEVLEQENEMVFEDTFTKRLLKERIFPPICVCTYKVFNKYEIIEEEVQEERSEFEIFMLEQEVVEKWREIHAKLLIKNYLIKYQKEADDDAQWFITKKWNQYKYIASKEKTNW